MKGCQKGEDHAKGGQSGDDRTGITRNGRGQLMKATYIKQLLCMCVRGLDVQFLYIKRKLNETKKSTTWCEAGCGV